VTVGCGIVESIICGGQTGADQAGLAAAKRLGIPTGGCTPRGWLTEDGPRPDLGAAYGLTQADAAAYPERTERNVLLADGTVVFGDARSVGSILTISLCRRHGRTRLVIPPDAAPYQAAQQLRAWLDEHRIATLNVAGNRASQAPKIAQLVRAVLEQALRDASSRS
jgi:hypothetical protein